MTTKNKGFSPKIHIHNNHGGLEWLNWKWQEKGMGQWNVLEEKVLKMKMSE